MADETMLYFIALLPPVGIMEQVNTLKEEMKERFKAQHALRSPPHITLQMPFRLPIEHEESFKKGLNDCASGLHPVTIHLKDFNAFSPRVIYIDIINPEPIVTIRNQVVGWLNDDPQWRAIRTSERFHPHMTIATRDLTEENFYRAWPEFASRTFEASFDVNELALLKHHGKGWDVLTTISFGR